MSDEATKPWQESMPTEQFEFMRDILAAPSPVGLEGAMTYGVLKPALEATMPDDWAVHQFRGNAGIVVDTAPGDTEKLTVMTIGHADKIRMQVRSIGDDGKIWINSDSFLPLTLLGHDVVLFSENPERPGKYRQLKGGTVEALGAIHFADAQLRQGKKGVKKEQLYVELHIHGEDQKEQIENLGIRPGDPILLDRPIRHGFADDTFTGAYLDNGLGCFVTAEIARLIAEEGGLENVRCLFTFASHEEIGRFGSRVMAGELSPDVVVGLDVNHDYEAAPNVSDRRFTPLSMGDGFTMSVGAIASEFLNHQIEATAKEHEIPMQRDVCGRDTGTDAMAAVLASVDAAATSVGFPIRNMHTISEAGHTGDVLAAIHVLTKTIQGMDEKGLTVEDFKNGHPRLDESDPLTVE